jgi:hypothetical protein
MRRIKNLGIARSALNKDPHLVSAADTALSRSGRGIKMVARGARASWQAGTLALLIVLASLAPAFAQYVDVPNFTGVSAGKQFRQAINDRFRGAVPSSPTLVPLHFFQLPAAVTSGQMYYLVDGTPGEPCAGGGTGALAVGVGGRWVCSAVGQTLQNVRSFGAKGDCSNLDNVAIQLALDATPNNSNGGNNPVYMPATNDVTGGVTTKCYLLGKPLFIPHGQLNLYGDGMEQTYLGTNYYGPALIAGTDHVTYATSLLTGPGNALDLGASGGFLELSMLLRNRLAGHSAFSIEFELKVPNSPSGQIILASQYDYPYQNYARPGLDQRGAFWIEYDANNGHPRFDFAATLTTSGFKQTNSASDSAPAGNHAMGLYYDGAHLWACVDAVSTSPVAATGTWSQSLWESITLPDQDGNGPINWPDGSGNFSSDSFNGQIDNMRIRTRRAPSAAIARRCRRRNSPMIRIPTCYSLSTDVPTARNTAWRARPPSMQCTARRAEWRITRYGSRFSAAMAASPTGWTFTISSCATTPTARALISCSHRGRASNG